MPLKLSHLRLSLSALIALLAPISAFAESTQVQDERPVQVADSADSAETKTIYEYIAHPTLQLITWPIETILVPTVGVLTYPVKPPLRYFLNENVIDRTIDMLSFGPKEMVMVYPTMAISPGTGSRTGFTLRHRALFGRPTERAVAQWVMYVNGDYKLRAYMTAANVFGTSLDAKLAATLNRVKNTSANQPGSASFWFYSDTSEVYTANVSHPLFEKFAGRLQYGLRINRFGQAPPQEDEIVSPFFFRDGRVEGVPDLRMRGLESEWIDNMFSFGLSRDTRNNPHITLDGSNFNSNWTYHRTDAGHDFHEYQVSWTKYFKLGKERYELSRDEEKAMLKGMNLKSLLANLEYQKLREQIFSRKVLAMRLYAAQSLELSRNDMPVYGLQTLGNMTPIRGYAGSRFRDYTVAAVSTEYRFPLMRLVDGHVFNEYGVFGRDFGAIDYADFKNSWGFGLRVRRPDIFLFRCEAGFHGSHGMQVNLTVDGLY